MRLIQPTVEPMPVFIGWGVGGDSSPLPLRWVHGPVPHRQPPCRRPRPIEGFPRSARRCREAFTGTASAPRYAMLACEIDVGGRFTVWGSRDSHTALDAHPQGRQGLAARPPGWRWRTGGMGRGGTTPLAASSVRRRGECVFATRPPPPGVAPEQIIPCGKAVRTLLGDAAGQPDPSRAARRFPNGSRRISCLRVNAESLAPATHGDLGQPAGLLPAARLRLEAHDLRGGEATVGAL